MIAQLIISCHYEIAKRNMTARCCVKDSSTHRHCTYFSAILEWVRSVSETLANVLWSELISALENGKAVCKALFVSFLITLTRDVLESFRSTWVPQRLCGMSFLTDSCCIHCKIRKILCGVKPWDFEGDLFVQHTWPIKLMVSKYSIYTEYFIYLLISYIYYNRLWYNKLYTNILYIVIYSINRYSIYLFYMYADLSHIIFVYNDVTIQIYF